MGAHLSNSHEQGAEALPRRVEVLAVVSSRYGSEQEANRPQSWDQRRSGVDVVQIVGGGSVRLASSPMQSVPKPGWVLMLTSGDATGGFQWTLYGMARSQ